MLSAPIESDQRLEVGESAGHKQLATPGLCRSEEPANKTCAAGDLKYSVMQSITGSHGTSLMREHSNTQHTSQLPPRWQQPLLPAPRLSCSRSPLVPDLAVGPKTAVAGTLGQPFLICTSTESSIHSRAKLSGGQASQPFSALLNPVTPDACPDAASCTPTTFGARRVMRCNCATPGESHVGSLGPWDGPRPPAGPSLQGGHRRAGFPSAVQSETHTDWPQISDGWTGWLGRTPGSGRMEVQRQKEELPILRTVTGLTLCLSCFFPSLSFPVCFPPFFLLLSPVFLVFCARGKEKRERAHFYEVARQNF